MPATPRLHVVRHVVNAVRAAGFPAGFEPGWEWRGRPYTFTPTVQYRHGTASSPSASNFASLRICRDGRPGIPGPLCQLYVSGTRRGAVPTLVVLSGGYANHAGRAASAVIHAASRGNPIPRPGADDMTANRYAWGTEYEHSNQPGEPIAPAMVELMTVLEAAIAEAEGWTDDGPLAAANHGIDHREATARKIDLPRSLGDQRARVAARLGGGTWRPVLRLTDPWTRGEWVAKAQRLLSAAGHKLEPDGVFGTATDGAVREFQGRHGLIVDGVIGPNTWRALEAIGQRKGWIVATYLYGRRGTPDEAIAFATCSAKGSGYVVVNTLADAKAAAEAGNPVIAVGGPAVDDLESAGVDHQAAAGPHAIGTMATVSKLLGG